MRQIALWRGKMIGALQKHMNNVKSKKAKNLLHIISITYPAIPFSLASGAKNKLGSPDLTQVNKTISGESSIFHHGSTLMEQPQ